MEFYYLNKMNVVPMPLLMLNLAEVLEGSSGEDEVEDKTFGRIFTRLRTRRGIFPFPSLQPFQGRDEEFLEISAFSSAILRTRQVEEFCLISRAFRGRDETPEKRKLKAKKSSNF